MQQRHHWMNLQKICVNWISIIGISLCFRNSINHFLNGKHTSFHSYCWASARNHTALNIWSLFLLKLFKPQHNTCENGLSLTIMTRTVGFQPPNSAARFHKKKEIGFLWKRVFIIFWFYLFYWLILSNKLLLAHSIQFHKLSKKANLLNCATIEWK